MQLQPHSDGQPKMASRDEWQQQYTKTPQWRSDNHSQSFAPATRRFIPDRMANYNGYTPRRCIPDRMANYSEYTPRRSIPGLMENYKNIYLNTSAAEYQSLSTSDPTVEHEMQRPNLQHHQDHSKSCSTEMVLLNREGSASGTEAEVFHDAAQGTSRHTSIDGSRIVPESHHSSSQTNSLWHELFQAVRTVVPKYKRLSRQSRLHGWRMGVLLGCLLSSFVLSCNIALVFVGAVTSSGYDKDGVATILEGDETTVSRWNTAAHIIINALSTILLSASNYTMQVLNSPTRQEIDNAHKNGRWLDIGLLSLHNLRVISRKRAVLCILLAISSTPLHLFYNASIFKIITQNAYQIELIDINSNSLPLLSNGSVYLENSRWRKIYDNSYVSLYGDLHLVVDRISFNGTAFNGSKNFMNVDFPMSEYLPHVLEKPPSISGEGWVQYETLMPAMNRSSKSTPNPAPDAVHIAEGLAVNLGHKSQMQISLYFLIVVISFNVLKLATMVSVLIMDCENYVVTLGDAAASFLERPDPLTEGRCILQMDELMSSYRDFNKSASATSLGLECYVSYPAKVWQLRTRRYCSSIGFDKVWSAVLSGSCLVFVIVFFPTRVNNLNDGIWQWGAASGGSLSFGSDEASTKGTIWNAWLSNMPQVLLSLCYLNLNTICTSMASTAEWNSLATSRKGLRVTRPFGEQRSTYFLQLPYRWAIPLMVTSGILHWLLSQSFFLTRIDTFGRNGELKSWTSSCGISFTSLITFSIVVLVLVVVTRLIGRLPMDCKLPLSESCSLMISAACHPAIGEVDPHLAKVQWGVVDGMMVRERGHCSLSSKPVGEPEAGKVYM